MSQFITGSLTYRVGIGWGQTMIWKHSQLHPTLVRSHWDNFTVNLGYVLGNRKCIPKSRFMNG